MEPIYERHAQRFTPRRPTSTWSAFTARTDENSRIYAFEHEDAALPPEAEPRLRADEAAWEFWESRPPGYRRVATWWVISAKRAETRERRLSTLVDDCAAGRLIKSQRR